MRYIKTVDDFPFLRVLVDNHEVIKKELIAYLTDPRLAEITGEVGFEHFAATRVKLPEKGSWKTFGFYSHFRDVIEYIEEHQINYNGIPVETWLEFDRYSKKTHFQRTRPLIEALMANEDNGVISAFFSSFDPGMKLPLHINDDPYMYRTHFGVIVPEGDLAIKVCDETVTWTEGSIIAFDPTNPHTAWNLTGQRRIVLILDVFKPEGDRQALRMMERKQFEKMMAFSASTFGMSGGYSALPRETFDRYAVPGIG